jgi:hypothetical protein
VRDAERLVELDRHLPDILDGKAQPKDAGEKVDFAQLCGAKKLHARAVRFYVEAFTANPERGDGVHSENRYDAACAAALAGCGQGHDTPADGAERARLRSRALGWLRDHLAFTSRHLARGTPAAKADVRLRLRHWQADPDLAGLRESAALDKLPEAERQAWRQFWDEVAPTANSWTKKSPARGQRRGAGVHRHHSPTYQMGHHRPAPRGQDSRPKSQHAPQSHQEAGDYALLRLKPTLGCEIS